MAPVYITPSGIRPIAFRFFEGKFFVNIHETLWHILYITREFIRAHSAEKIKGSNVLVNKQYSPEKFYPDTCRAKKDTNAQN